MCRASKYLWNNSHLPYLFPQIAKFLRLTRGQPGFCRPQMGPMLSHELCYQGPFAFYAKLGTHFTNNLCAYNPKIMWSDAFFHQYSNLMGTITPIAIIESVSSNVWDRITWWRHQMETFSALPAIWAGNSPVPHKGQWSGVLMFSLICARINGSVNNREAGIWDAIAPIMMSL